MTSSSGAAFSGVVSEPADTSGTVSEIAPAELEDSATTTSSGTVSELATAELEESAAAAPASAELGAWSELATAELGGSATVVGGRLGTIRTCVGSGMSPYLLLSQRQLHGSFTHTWNL